MSREREEFAAYFNVRRDPVRRTAYLLCGDWHLADDLTQIAFVRLAAGWGRVRDAGALNGFVHTCLVRAYLSERRRWWRSREQATADPPAGSVPGTGFDDAVSERQAVAAALRRLPPRQRAVLVLRFYADFDVAATAEALGCATGTVKSQTARALANLRELLGPIPGFGGPDKTSATLRTAGGA
jgi:RNA polymerase sigma-70 factor (sigma-E family)